MLDARLKAGLTQSTLAIRLGRPQSFVAKYENGTGGGIAYNKAEFIDIVEAIGLRPERIFQLLLRD